MIVTYKHDSVSYDKIHEMVLRQSREKAIEETKLRVVGLSNYQAASRRQKKTGEEGRHTEPVGERPAKKEERICNHCGVQGHIARNCPTLPSGSRPVAGKSDRKRQTPAGDDKSPTRPKLAMEVRLGARGAIAARPPNGRTGGSPAPRPVNTRNNHMTEGVIYSHCGTRNHTAAQCWTLHPDLCPFPKWETSLMARVQREGERAGKAIQAE